jgi:DNA-binding NarL/FixJ family response regulator
MSRYDARIMRSDAGASVAPNGAVLDAAHVKRRVRVLLADDHALMREGTRRLLEAQPRFEVIAETADGPETVRLTRELQPDVVLLDLNMPSMTGAEVVRSLRASHSEASIVVLTGFGSDVEAMLRLGARGFLSKTVSSAELFTALDAVAAGGTYVQADLRRSTDASVSAGDSSGPIATQREMDVLRLVASGLQNDPIARRLNTTERTVRFHLENLFRKLGATSRTDLVNRARQAGWLG